MVSRVGSSSLLATDFRTAALDAAAKGKLGLAAAQAYSGASSTAATSTTTTVTTQDGNGSAQSDNSQTPSGGLSTLLSSYYSQMLGLQEASSNSGTASAARAASGAYAAGSSLTADNSEMDLHIPGLPQALSSGRRIDLSV